jgi:hypothetical protein
MPHSTREDSEGHGSLVLVPVALVAVLVSGLWAWRLASSQFAPSPVIPSPGSIIVGTYGHATDHNPIDAYLEYDASLDQHSTSYSLTLTQQDTSGASGSKSPGIVIFLCGAAAKNPSLTSHAYPDEVRPITWRAASQFDGYEFTGGVVSYAFPEQCIFTLLTLAFDPAAGSSTVFLSGHSGPPPSKVSGAGIIYAWPGIFSLPQADYKGNFTVVPLIKGSTYTVAFPDLPNDISNIVTNPDLTPSPSGMQLTGSFNYGFTDFDPEFRLSGDLSNRQANGQRNLFIAGALVGVAGGAVIWLLELLTKVLLALRSSPMAAAAEIDVADKRSAEREQAKAGGGNGKDKSPSGLGWPS